MSVPILSLSGLSAAKALEDVAALLDIEQGEVSLKRLLVLDDTTLLVEHIDAYQKLDSGYRVGTLMCVALGPRPGDGRRLELPGTSLGGVQGAPVLWVSRLAGINWKVSKTLVAERHLGYTATSVDRHPLIALLKIEEIFDRINEIFRGNDDLRFRGVSDRVASPGLWLADGDDEAATFAGALAVAIARACDLGPALRGPFAELTPDRTGGAQLADEGPLARGRKRVDEMNAVAVHALERRGGLSGLMRRGSGDLQEVVAKVGEALGDLRRLADEVLRDADVSDGSGELAAAQQAAVRNAGIEFAARMRSRPAAGTAGTTESAAEESPVFQAVAKAIRAGDPIPAVSERLTETERLIERRGSAQYSQEVADRCPAALLEALTSGPRKPSRRGGAVEARRELGLDEAVSSAGGLVDLVLSVANREWSPAAVTSDDLIRAKAALDGVASALAGFASETHSTRDGTRAARLARLAESLDPALRDLIITVVAEEMASESASGPEARREAKGRADTLLKKWRECVQADGVTAQPPFASERARQVSYAIGEDVAGIREALMYSPRDEMWQLCRPEDLSALDVDGSIESMRFATRLAEEALGSLSGAGGDPVWLPSGSFAGVLRFVPLRSGTVVPLWSNAGPDEADD